MKFPIATSLLHILLMFVWSSVNDVRVVAAVGLYGSDRYEGLPQVCLLPMDFGYCRAKVPRYYFDTRRMRCAMFYWGGCAGNENNFKSLEECNDICTPYEENSNEVVNKVQPSVKQVSRENSQSRTTSSRDNSIQKSASKFAPKSNSTLRETGYNGPAKASPKSLNVNPPSQPNTSSEDEDEDYYEE